MLGLHFSSTRPLDDALGDHPLAGFVITATSANISGEPPVARASLISSTLASQLDCILDGGTLPGGSVSTIVDVTGDTPQLVRPGAIAWDRVLESLR